ncbi:MAG: DNA translocase FtsK [Patescibacteria group bacterium]
MAKKKRGKENKKKTGLAVPPLSLHLKPETTKSIYAILSMIAAALFLLGPLGQGGPAGSFLYESLTALFGFGYFLIPISLVFLGIGLFRQREQSGLGGTRVFGASILFMSGIAILSLIDNHGGLVGQWIAMPFTSLFDIALASIVLGGIAIVGTLLALDTPLGIPAFALSAFRLPWTGKKAENIAGEVLEEKEIEHIAEATNVETHQEEKPTRKEKVPEKKIEAEPEANFAFAPIGQAYNPPPLSLLDRDKGKPDNGDIKANANLIKRTLQNFGITVEMDEVSIGPTVTRYALKPAEGVRLQKILSLQNNLELALAAHPVRIEAPIPGKSLVGIEVPNTKKSTVGLGSLLSDTKFEGDKRPLMVALGRDIAGASHFANIGKMPHLLIAGATGAGKSVSIHALITSLLYRNGPAALRFIMIDPKRVELTLYNPIPHLLTPVITDPKKAILSLKWAAKEMERRYTILETHAVRDVQSYHENIAATWDGTGDQPDQMPYILIILDELADIMQTYPRELEAAIVRLAQMSRAVGIHLILSTQRPSVNVITGLIKANVPARIALQVASQIDSRTILDAAGAEKLLGAGDMLFQSADMSKPHRIQTAFISENEVKTVVEYIRKHNEPSLDSITLSSNMPESPNAIFSASLEDDDVDDDLFTEAKQIVEEAGKASTSYLQRKLRIGYARAARLMDILEEKGIIGAADGARPRDVLTTSEGETTMTEENNGTT